MHEKTFLFRDFEMGFCYDYHLSLCLRNTVVARKRLISTLILFIYQQLRTLLFVIFILCIELLYKTLFLEKVLIPSIFNSYVLKKPERAKRLH